MVGIKLPKKIVVAPVGWYEGRLWKSILKSGADKLYLIKGVGEGESRIKEITDHVANELKKRLSLYGKGILEIDDTKFADFRDLEKTYETYISIIEWERQKDKNCEIIIDVTSTTKEGAIAALLLSRYYDLKISYVSSKDKYNWIDSKEKNLKDVLNDLKHQISDSGNEYIQHASLSSPLHEDWILALKEVFENPELSMGAIIKKVLKVTGNRKTNAASYRYWTRVFDRLKTERLVDMTKIGRSTYLALPGLTKALISGILKSREGR